MTENEALKTLEDLQRLLTNYRHISKELTEANGMAIQALEEIQRYRAIGTIEEFKELKLLFGNENVEISELITKILKEYPEYLSIGTVEEFKALKESELKCKDCAGCTNWKCDCANERDYAITQFANFLHEKAKENNGLRLSSETRSWTHPCIFDYLEEFKNEQTSKAET